MPVIGDDAMDMPGIGAEDMAPEASLEDLVGVLPAVEYDIPPVHFAGKVVHFDRGGHVSGCVRAFINCRGRAHGRCEKYQFIDSFPDTNQVGGNIPLVH